MNLATHFDRSKLWDFTFLRWLAPDLLDGFSIGRYEKKRESFDLFPAKFESGAMRFSGGKSLRRWSYSKNGFNPCPSIIRNSKRRTQNRSKTVFEAKGREYTTGKVIQRLFNIDIYTYLTIYRYR